MPETSTDPLGPLIAPPSVLTPPGGAGLVGNSAGIPIPQAAPVAATAQSAATTPAATPGGGRQSVVDFWATTGGVPQHVAEGIGDAVGGESGYNSSIPGDFKNGVPTSGGLYQHHEDRLARLKMFAVKQGKPWTDPAVQNAFALSEVKGGDPIAAAHWQEIVSAPDRATAKALWSKYFERPAGSDLVNRTVADVERVRSGQYTAAENLNRTAAEMMKQIGSDRGSLSEAMKRVHLAQEKADEANTAATDALKHPPAQPEIDGIKHLGGLATFVGIFGGLMTRRPMQASLNAAASAIEAYNDGDREKYKLAYQNWSHQTDMLFKTAQMTQTRVHDILYNEQMGANERNALLQSTLQAAGLTQLADRHKIEGDAAVVEWDKFMQTAQNKSELERTKMAHANELAELKFKLAAEKPTQWGTIDKLAQEQIAEVEKKTGVPTTAEDKKKIYKSVSDDLSPKGVGRQSPAAVYGRKVLEENPEISAQEFSRKMGDYQRDQTIERAFAGGIMGRNVVALNTASDHMILLKEYANALNNNDIPRANAVLNQLATEMGKPEVTNFETARDIAADEIVRLLTSTGGTEADRAGMQSRFRAAGSPAQLMGAINVAERFVAGRFNGLEQEYARNDPARRKAFEEEMLTPAARQLFVKSGGVPSGGAASGGGGAPVPVPAGHQGDADGTKYKGSDGKVYVKRGEQMVPE